MERKQSLQSYLLCALFAALIAICSQIMVPLPFTPVPINLALLAVWVCGGVLGAKKGVVSVGVYILLGAIGVPVFHGLQGGLGIMAGPTGGYIIGFLPAVAIMGLLSQCRGRPRRKGAAANAIFTIVIGLPALAACYGLGTAWFMISTGTGFAAAMLLCVIPFIPGDILKLVGAGAVCAALEKPMRVLAR